MVGLAQQQEQKGWNGPLQQMQRTAEQRAQESGDIVVAIIGSGIAVVSVGGDIAVVIIGSKTVVVSIGGDIVVAIIGSPIAVVSLGN